MGSLDGQWSGVVGIVEYDATLIQQGLNLTGSGAIGPTPSSGAEFPTRLASLTGTFHAPDVRLTFGSPSAVFATFSGVLVSPTVIRGVIQIDSTPGTSLTLYRR